MEKEMNRTERKRAQTGYIAALLGFIAAVFVDQITKYLAVIFLKNKNPFVLIDGVFQLRYLENRGAAFGMMQNMQYLFIAGAIIIVVIFAFLYGRIPFQKKYLPLRICGILICAGAVGNMIDRVSQGYVVDFLYFNLINFPIFNVADCYVTVGAFLLVVLIFFYYREEEMACFSLKNKKEDLE